MGKKYIDFRYQIIWNIEFEDEDKIDLDINVAIHLTPILKQKIEDKIFNLNELKQDLIYKLYKKSYPIDRIHFINIDVLQSDCFSIGIGIIENGILCNEKSIEFIHEFKTIGIEKYITYPSDTPSYDGYVCKGCGNYLHPVENHSIGICSTCEPIKFDEYIKKMDEKK